METPRSILITGNQGYLGPVVVRHLRRVLPGARLVGFDTGFFTGSLVGDPDRHGGAVDEQIRGDVRDATQAHFQGIDAVVLLAAVSNDPMGVRFEAATGEINRDAVVTNACLAREAGVRNVVFASSCSLYGTGTSAPRRESDELLPLTAYARSKAAAEQQLAALASDTFAVTALRFATACGVSPGFRTDLVLNDFVTSALATGSINVLSDGRPWRPLIDVLDMARAVEWALCREQDPPFLTVNVGAQSANYRVVELARRVAQELPGVSVEVNTSAAPDPRSYRVDFSRFERIATHHQPRQSLRASVERLHAFLRERDVTEPDFRRRTSRLDVLDRLVASGRLSSDLRWNGDEA